MTMTQRMSLGLACATLLACSGTTAMRDTIDLDNHPDCRARMESPLDEVLENSMRRAHVWLPIVPYRASRVSDAVPQSDEALPRKDGVRYLAVRSFPTRMVFAKDGRKIDLSKRTFVYDQALAAIYLTWTGDLTRAADLCATIELLQSADGSWGFSFDSSEDGFYNRRYVRSGTVAWAAYALAYYEQRTGDARFRPALLRALEHLEGRRVKDAHDRRDGLVTGGRGRWTEDFSQFFPDPLHPAAITEHQFDAHMLARAAKTLGAPGLEPDAMAKAIVDRLWLGGDGHFAVAAVKDDLDKKRALDSAGGWGSLWLGSVGLEDRSRASFEFTRTAFAVTSKGLRGYRPYLDPVDGKVLDADEPRLVFVEGTMAMGLAALRLGERDIAEQVLRSGLAMQCVDGPGLPYANETLGEFPRSPSVASTLWYLFLAGEWRDPSKHAPIWSAK